MPVFVTSTAAALRHGVYAIERNPPATVRATGSAVACLVEQFPWGPAQSIVTPSSIGDLLNMIAPPGMDRTGSGYLSVIRKGWPLLKVVRVIDTAAVKAFAHLPDVVPANIVLVTLKYPGTAGNSCTWAVTAASDGDSNHFNLAVTVTGTTGTTTDFFQNLNYSGVGSDSTPDLTKTLLVGAIAKELAGRPLNGTGSFASGTNGTIDATTYVGTQGTANKGMALLEGDRSIDHVFAGDPGNTIRAAVNAGLKAHADYMTDRVAYLNGNSGQAQSAAITDVASYRSLRCVYVDAWPYIFDDTDGTKRLVPPASFAASVAAQLPPSTSIAWKADKVQTMLGGIVDLEADRGDASFLNTAAGIVSLNREIDGGFTFEAGVNTDAPVVPSKADLTRTRMGHYIARSEVASLRGFIDAPNVKVNQDDELAAITVFLEGLKQAAKFDPNNNVHIVDYQITDVNSVNTPESIAAGDYTIPQSIQTSTGQARLFLSLNFGPTVKVSTTL